MKLEKRIIGGTQVKGSDYGFMTLIKIDRKDQGLFICGGALINGEYIVTAAHCVSESKGPINTTQVAVGLGSEVIKQLSFSQAVGITVHPDWDMSNLKNDIAIIRIEKLGYNPTIYPIELPTKKITQNRYVYALGFGRNSSSPDAGPTNLNLARLVSGSITKCTENRPDLNTQALLCTNNTLALGQDTCLGDSGGPLFIRENGTKILVGITSFGTNSTGYGTQKCGLSDGIGFYTNILHHTEFIKKTIAGPVL
ncbi:Coagulation factor XI [Smittium culicis]|uniref:Coagulation factor XI n=1 Tax=Smittium culicis TaxID=133412 RepID=A0A1R1Y4B6_9FUNG|nr:Coagulation factor XI [Smittium culicis]